MVRPLRPPSRHQLNAMPGMERDSALPRASLSGAVLIGPMAGHGPVQPLVMCSLTPVLSDETVGLRRRDGAPSALMCECGSCRGLSDCPSHAAVHDPCPSQLPRAWTRTTGSPAAAPPVDRTARRPRTRRWYGGRCGISTSAFRAARCDVRRHGHARGDDGLLAGCARTGSVERPGGDALVSGDSRGRAGRSDRRWPSHVGSCPHRRSIDRAGRRETLVVFHGSGILHGFAD